MGQNAAIWLILGPSGVGKSSFAEYLHKQHRWLWLEVDQYPSPVDGIDFYDLRGPWDAFYKSKSAVGLSADLRTRIEHAGAAGCAVSFPGGVVLSTDHIAAANTSSMKVIYLYGSAADCIDGFLAREQQSGRSLDVDHWFLNNYQPYMMMSSPAFKENRILVFDSDGRHRSYESIFSDIKGEIAQR